MKVGDSAFCGSSKRERIFYDDNFKKLPQNAVINSELELSIFSVALNFGVKLFLSKFFEKSKPQNSEWTFCRIHIG